MLTAQLIYTPEIVKKAVYAYIRRGIGTGGFISLIIMIAIAVPTIAMKPSSWLAGVAFGGSSILVLIIVGLYFMHYRRAMAKLQRMSSKQAVLTLTESEFSVSSEASSFSVPWTTFSELWQFSSFWLVIYCNGQFITLPLANLSPEVQSFISSHVHVKRNYAA